MSVIPFHQQLEASVEMSALLDALIRAHWAYEGWELREITPELRRAYLKPAEIAVGIATRYRPDLAFGEAERYAAEHYREIRDEDSARIFGFQIADHFLHTLRGARR